MPKRKAKAPPAGTPKGREAIAARVCEKCSGKLKVTVEDPEHRQRGLECEDCHLVYLETDE